MRLRSFLILVVLAGGCGAPMMAPADLAQGVADLLVAADLAIAADLSTVPDEGESVDLTAVDLATTPCATDGECAAPNPRCDPVFKKCVACLPQNDNCPMGRYCVYFNDTYLCAPGCQKDAECKGMGPSWSCCGHLCVDTERDTSHCGTCGKLCGPGQTCCTGTCADTTTNVKHCGGCGIACDFQNAMGNCVGARCNVVKCTQGFADCDGLGANGCEVNSLTDARHCGTCGKTCTSVINGSATCGQGNCSAMCAAGFADCDKTFENGCEVSTSSEPAHCGKCGAACPAVANGVAGCAAGKCGISHCNAGFADCNGMADDGCETAIGKDEKNCGACGNACAAPMNADAACTNGTCGAACTGSFRDCNGNLNDGCEMDTSKDARHCGACGTVCPNGPGATGACSAGKCGLTCNANLADCNKMASDGCEVNLTNDWRNCGACAMGCTAPSGTSAPTCAMSKCGSAACGMNFKDCNASAMDGCETDVTRTPAHCGGCGKPCAVPANAAASCTNGTCGMGACNTGFRDCRNGAMDGCETNATNDVNNCGACNTRCTVANGTAACVNSSCAIAMCNTTFRDCRNGVTDGCETNTATDLNHCGACGAKCPSTLPNATSITCAASACAIAACAFPYQNCDGILATGCESNRTTDPKNCGVCGVVCASGVCEKGVCKPRVLIAGAPSVPAWNSDVQATIEKTGAFAGVDIFNVETGTPALSLLKTYDAVLVYSEDNFKDAKALGDNLADYFDGGGRVVVAAFANATAKLGGRWDTGMYQLINPIGQSAANEAGNLQIVEPTSPLLTGVVQVRAMAAYKSSGGNINGGVVVARWGSSQAPIIVRGTKNGRARVDLNLFPPSSMARADLWTGDGANLLRNALLFRGHCHSIVGKGGAPCPSGRLEFCDAGTAITTTNETQASAACAACYGVGCSREIGDCAGPAYGPRPPGQYVCGDAYFGVAAGCGGGPGRIFAICTPLVTYGRWAD